MASTKTSKDRYPPQIKYIVGNEACERYSYYGMRSILVVFMVQYLLFEKAHATAVYHYFVAAAYLLPVAGAYLSDRYWGKYKTILYLSIVYCIGHGVLAVWENEQGLYAGLFLISLGSGGIKPCVSAHVGDQFKKGQEHMLNRVFDLFYWMINFGSTFSTIITPWMLPKYGPGWAFGVPGILMFIATVLFWMGRKQFVHVPPTGYNPHSTGKVIMSALRNTHKRKKGQSFFDTALGDHPKDAVEGVKAAFGVGRTFITVSVFWALFDQHGSTWVLQAKEMDLMFMGIQFLPSQIQALNPIMVMCLIPIFAYGVYPLAGKFITVTPLRKMGAGMFLAGFSFVQVAMIQTQLDAGNQINVGWQFFPYITITIAEIMISITGLEFAYTQAPRSMKSTIMSMWLLTVFFGNMITGYVAQTNQFEGAMFFMFFAFLMFSVAIIFALVASRYQMRNYMETKDYKAPVE